MSTSQETHKKLRKRSFRRATKETLHLLERNRWHVRRGGDHEHYAEDPSGYIRLKFNTDEHRVWLWNRRLEVNLQALSPEEFLSLVVLEAPGGQGGQSQATVVKVLGTDTISSRRHG